MEIQELVLQTIRDISTDMYKQKLCPGVAGSDCFAAEHLCGHCLHQTHIHNPFHHVGWRRVAASFAQEYGLQDSAWAPCRRTLPVPSVDHLFHVVDATSVHRACIYYCGCERSLGLNRGDQLMNRRLYPDHPMAPRTAVVYQLAYTVVNVLALTFSTPCPTRCLMNCSSSEQQRAWHLRSIKHPIDIILIYFLCRYLLLPCPAPMSSTKKRKASENVDSPTMRPCRADLREAVVADNEAIWSCWDSAMEGLRDFYHLDNPNDERINGGAFSESAPCTRQTDGEGIEMGWALLSSLAHSTRMMGPGVRHRSLEDDFANLHWHFSTTEARMRPFENRPLTVAQREFLVRSSAPTRKRTRAKVKLFPLDAEEEVEVKLEDENDDDLLELVQSTKSIVLWTTSLPCSYYSYTCFVVDAQFND
ncbi:hypothetical protein DFH06DRAFT_1326764 [Mycena polygramma]|nr:hypothetical protein DFH06DRAFT_1326764 [Mycena polygramma]